MNIAIIGTGGIGGYFGGKLAQAGNNVTFIARGEHLRAIREKGLIVKSIKGDFTIYPAKVTDKFSEIEAPDLVILGVKAWQVKQAAIDLKNIIKPDTSVLPMQNGVMACEELLEVLNKKQVISGLCRIFSKIESPGVINHFGIEPTIVFAEPDNTKSTRIENIKTLFDQSGIASQIADDIITELWKKLMIIGSGGLMALTRSSYGAVRENKETRSLMQALLQEIYAVSLKAGSKIEADFVDKTMSYIDAYPYDSNTSLARDIWEGKPSELEYQSGSVTLLGEKYGVPTPVNRFIYHCLLPMERKARGVNGNRLTVNGNQ